jgi:hypothetical protein
VPENRLPAKPLHGHGQGTVRQMHSRVKSPPDLTPKSDDRDERNSSKISFSRVARCDWGVDFENMDASPCIPNFGGALDEL